MARCTLKFIGTKNYVFFILSQAARHCYINNVSIYDLKVAISLLAYISYQDPNSAYSREREPRRPIFNFFSNSSLPRVFSFQMSLIVIGKWVTQDYSTIRRLNINLFLNRSCPKRCFRVCLSSLFTLHDSPSLVLLAGNMSSPIIIFLESWNLKTFTD